MLFIWIAKEMNRHIQICAGINIYFLTDEYSDVLCSGIFSPNNSNKNLICTKCHKIKDLI